VPLKPNQTHIMPYIKIDTETNQRVDSKIYFLDEKLAGILNYAFALNQTTFKYICPKTFPAE
jgi:hypothetical protein